MNLFLVGKESSFIKNVGVGEVGRVKNGGRMGLWFNEKRKTD